MKKISVILYGKEADCGAALDTIKDCKLISNYHSEYYIAHTREELEITAVEEQPTLAVVLADGAKGMEGVYFLRNLLPNLAIFWFSDDCGFSLYSHMMNCSYFSIKPITKEKIETAFKRCVHIGRDFYR